MNLVRFFHNPNHTVNRSLVNDLFENLLVNDYDEDYLNECKCKPATNIFETDKDYQLEFLLPGFQKKDIKVDIDANILTIKVNRNKQKEDKHEKCNYSHREFRLYNFERRFEVPETVDVDKINGNFDNGILTLLLPKKREVVEKSVPQEIQIA